MKDEKINFEFYEWGSNPPEEMIGQIVQFESHYKYSFMYSNDKYRITQCLNADSLYRYKFLPYMIITKDGLEVLKPSNSRE